MYIIPKILEAAKQAEVSEIDAQHICDTLVKMFHTCSKVTCNRSGHEFRIGEIVKLIEVSEDAKRYINQANEKWWLLDDEHEPTTETF